MTEPHLREILQRLQTGQISLEQCLERLRHLPFESLDWACLDHHRELRKGFPEVVYGPGKTDQQLAEIMRRLVDHGGPVLVTRISAEQAKAVAHALPEVTYHPIPKALSWKAPGDQRVSSVRGTVFVVSAGTSDLPVAEEACLTLELMDHPLERIFDVGVAGIHRLFHHYQRLETASVVVAVAGMEGALASVLGGLLSVPVIAVPTSVGYGASFHGLAALLSMLNSCATGVAVVNIDNGFGAGALAAMINSR